MEKRLALTKSLEDYLEVILRIIKKQGSARITDIADSMEVAASSVNEMVAKLKDRNLVVQEKYGPVRLTNNGRDLAEKINCTHEIIYKFLNEYLKVNPQTADKDACLMEHSISTETLLKMIKLLSEENIINKDDYCLSSFYDNQWKGKDSINSATTELKTLDQLSIGDRAEVAKISISGRTKRKLMDMGLSSGAVLLVKGKAPMGDPIEIKIRGYNLTLRESEAEKVKVKVVNK